MFLCFFENIIYSLKMLSYKRLHVGSHIQTLLNNDTQSLALQTKYCPTSLQRHCPKHDWCWHLNISDITLTLHLHHHSLNDLRNLNSTSNPDMIRNQTSDLWKRCRCRKKYVQEEIKSWLNISSTRQRSGRSLKNTWSAEATGKRDRNKYELKWSFILIVTHSTHCD